MLGFGFCTCVKFTVTVDLQGALEVLHDRLLGSLGAAVADDVCPGTKRNGASVCSVYLLEKMASKISHIPI